MKLTSLLNESLVVSRLSRPLIYYLPRCKPKILIVTDGGLGFSTSGFGLSRFVEAIATHSSVTLTPAVTLAHRGGHSSPVVIDGVSYTVATSFNFATATPAVTRANYDQIWLLGIDPSGSISNAEITVLADFMNAGGGVFATGDHAALGKTMSGNLPRIRHMREWQNVPMGLEALPTALDRIDTIVNPGANNIYEFDDQSDNIPQRIYPNYAVTGPGFGDWTATIHPLLLMNGGSISKEDGDPAAFSNDIDVLPDHPHESECYEVSATANSTALNGTYTVAGMNFPEFPNAASGGGKVGSEIVAFSVSGGRSVRNGNWKPPVRPRMFGAISAFNGHLANPLSGQSARPGRIVCEATWHHYVNINLDGSGTGRTGLGTGSGAGFVPSADLLKIYKYYQNIVNWLQPNNRRYCWYILRLTLVRYHPLILEEILEVPEIIKRGNFNVLGQVIMGLLDKAQGPGQSRIMLLEALGDSKEGQTLVDFMTGKGSDLSGDQFDRIIGDAYGRIMADIVGALPALDDPKFEDFFKKGELEKLEERLPKLILESATKAAQAQAERSNKQSRGLKSLMKSIG
ncbi:hypothetical protein [Parasphingorhabdus sp.]|uniref:hypothetical protein n=1 Tax=Parasphingorhabdus sp. TaxID=2709688 RepID=UPI003001D966